MMLEVQGDDNCFPVMLFGTLRHAIYFVADFVSNHKFRFR